MLFEIKQRFNGSVLFSLETASFSNCVEAAVRTRADFAYADLAGATGINKHQVTPLRILLDQPGPIRAYKLINKHGEGPFNGGIKYDGAIDSFSVELFDKDENSQCGAGINLATLDWCMKEWREDYRILLMEFFAADLVVPTLTDGKFRVRKCRRVGEVDLKEIGLIGLE